MTSNGEMTADARYLCDS